MGNTTKDVSVTVHLDLNHSPPFTFETSLPMSGKNHLKFSKGKADGFLISYTLDDPGNTYTFGSDLNQALWSTSEAVCPTSPGQWDQFTAQEITNGGMTLVVHNANRDKQDFGYTLRITSDGGNSYMELDPIGTNDNSNLKRTFGVAVGAAVAGAAVGYLATQFAMPAATSMAALTGAVIGAVVGFGIYSLMPA